MEPQAPPRDQQLRAFLEEACDVTGSADAFVFTRDLVEAFRAYQSRMGWPELGDRAVALLIAAHAETYRDPETRKTYARRRLAKSNGYSGIALRSAAPPG